MLVATTLEDQGDKVCRVYTSSDAKLLEAPDPATAKNNWPGIAQDWMDCGRYGNHNAIDHDEIATPRKPLRTRSWKTTPIPQIVDELRF